MSSLFAVQFRPKLICIFIWISSKTGLISSCLVNSNCYTCIPMTLENGRKWLLWNSNIRFWIRFRPNLNWSFASMKQISPHTTHIHILQFGLVYEYSAFVIGNTLVSGLWRSSWRLYYTTVTNHSIIYNRMKSSVCYSRKFVYVPMDTNHGMKVFAKTTLCSSSQGRDSYD